MADQLSRLHDLLVSAARADALVVVRMGTREEVLPEQLLDQLAAMVELAQQGAAPTVVPTRKDLTTTQAAELIGVSRRHLTALMDSGELRYHLTGTHRRIAYEDAVAYGEKALTRIAAPAPAARPRLSTVR